MASSTRRLTTGTRTNLIGEPAAAEAVEMKDGDNIVVASDSFPKQPPADALERA